MVLAAFSFGRKWGNTEVLLKEALMAAEKKGVEVKFYRLRDYELHNCTSCLLYSCAAIRNPSNCRYKDDGPFLIEEFLNCDGVLLGAPVYAVSPNSMFFAFRDRIFGPKLDIARKAAGREEQPWIKGRGKARAAGLISVGGAMTENWTSMGLPSLYTATFSPQAEVVDHVNVFGVADYAEATIHDEWLARARELGSNVADAMLSGDHSWRGGDRGTCPCCHLDLIQILPGTNKVCCPVCGVYGNVIIKDNQLSFEWPDTEEYRLNNRQAVSGKLQHLLEISDHHKIYEPRKDEATEKLNKYKEYNQCEVLPPGKA